MSTNNITNNNTTTKKPLRVGVLCEEVQMSDLSGIDILGNISSKTLNTFADMDPKFEPLRNKGVPMEFLYISSTLDHTWMTSEMHVKPTHTYENAPRDLDILLIGGPYPATVKEESLVFLREASQQTKVILATCTGGIWLAKSGSLDGKKATTNRMMLDLAKIVSPTTEWLDQRWVVEEGHFEGAQIWTAGGAGCGKF